jgi:hypothetical protein
VVRRFYPCFCFRFKFDWWKFAFEFFSMGAAAAKCGELVGAVKAETLGTATATVKAIANAKPMLGRNLNGANEDDEDDDRRTFMFVCLFLS